LSQLARRVEPAAGEVRASSPDSSVRLLQWDAAKVKAMEADDSLFPKYVFQFPRKNDA